MISKKITNRAFGQILRLKAEFKRGQLDEHQKKTMMKKGLRLLNNFKLNVINNNHTIYKIGSLKNNPHGHLSLESTR